MPKKLFFAFCAFLISNLALTTEKGIAHLSPSNDIAPIIDHHNPAQTDSMWQLQFCYNGQMITNDNQLLGVEFDGEYFWLTGANNPDRNKLYKLDENGLLLGSYFTSTNSSWGWRDLAWDGTYLYASEDNIGGVCRIDVIDPLAANPGIAVDSILVTGVGTNFARAIAYDPTTCHFYTANLGMNIMEIDTLGNIIRSVTSPLNAIFGLAWDDDAEDGPWLWAHNQSGNPANTLYRIDPVTLQNITFSYNYGVIPPNTTGIAGGLAYTDQLYPDYSTMIVLIQGTPFDQFAGFEMYPIINPSAPNAVTNFSANHNNAILTATLNWANPVIQFNNQPLTQLSGVRVYRNNQQVIDLTNVQIGQAMNYNDNVISVGMFNYQVTPYNDSGNGVSEDTSLWIGLDTPGAPGNFSVEPDSNGALTVFLNWTVPQIGAHNGYFTPASVTSYNIYRGVGTEPLAFIVNTTTLNYLDHPTTAGLYRYGVAGVNSSGEGVMNVFPSQVYVGFPPYLPIPYNWIEISNTGTNTGITGDDQNLGPFPIGFGFPFMGNVYTTIRVCSNGFASFTSTSTAFNNASIPNTAEPNNLIAPFWDDLNANGGGGIWYQTLTNPTRFVIEWNHINQYGALNTPRTFELILYPIGDIVFMYNDFVGGTVTSATVGTENSSGTEGIQLTFNGSGPFLLAPQTGVVIPWIEPPWPIIELTLTPVNPPIVIPAIGGVFSYNISAQNLINENIPFQVWNMVTLPNGANYGPVLGPIGLVIGPLGNIARVRNQSVPATAPAGQYIYRSYVGTSYPIANYDSASFTFTKSTLRTGESASIDSWNLFDWNENTEVKNNLEDSFIIHHSSFIISASPNPFNSSTVISFELPDASEVDITAYDISGREIKSIVNGQWSTGKHQVEWNAEVLPSGIYFVRLTAGSIETVNKVLLLK